MRPGCPDAVPSRPGGLGLARRASARGPRPAAAAAHRALLLAHRRPRPAPPPPIQPPGPPAGAGQRGQAARHHSRRPFCFRVPPPGPGRPKRPPGSPGSRAAACGQPAPPPPPRSRRLPPGPARPGTASRTPRASGRGGPARMHVAAVPRTREPRVGRKSSREAGGDGQPRAIPVPAAGRAAGDPEGRGACGVTERWPCPPAVAGVPGGEAGDLPLLVQHLGPCSLPLTPPLWHTPPHTYTHTRAGAHAHSRTHTGVRVI